MTQSNNNRIVVPVVTKEGAGALASTIFASRPGLVATEPLEYEGGVAVKAIIAGLTEGDFVVRSVKAGKRRSFQVLAGEVPAALAASQTGFANIVDNQFVVPAEAVTESGEVAMAGLAARTVFGAGDVIVLTEGELPADFAGAHRVN